MAEQNMNIPWEGWKYVRAIGKGGFGTVYEIERTQHGITETAAMKRISIPQSADEVDTLKIEGYDDESITQRFSGFAEDIIREYGMMVQMKGNANIVYCDDYKIIQQDDGFGWDIYIRMELLTPLVKALGQVSSEDQIIRFGIELCAALEVCQKRNVIHRDIKPQNIFVSDDGVFKLGDFGIARTAERTTRATVGIGTYQFMAPEVNNNQPYGATVDIYSLGMVMYWLLNGRRTPFLPLPPTVPKHSEEEQARQRRFAGEKIPAPRDGSTALKQIVLKACAFDPKERYQTARQMREALLRLSGQPVLPVAVQPEPTSKPESRPRKDLDDAETMGLYFDHSSRKNTVQEEKTVGPMFIGTSVDEDTQSSPASGVVPEEEKLRQANKTQMKKKYRNISMILLGIIVVASTALILSYNKCKIEGHSWVAATCTEPQRCSVCNAIEGSPLGHLWKEATCESPKICAICSATEGSALGHDWLDATCESPKICAICSAAEGSALGHYWLDATKDSPSICSLCGTTTGTRILPTLMLINLQWSVEGSPKYGCQNNTATLCFPSWDSFSASKITIKNTNQDTISLDCFSFEWVSETVHITPSEALPFGVYSITFVCNDGRTTISLCYGYEDEIYLCWTDAGWHNCQFQNWKNERYLVKTNAGLETSTSYADRSTFAWSGEICGLEVASDGYAYPSNNGRMVQFTTSTYVLHGGEDLYVFTYNGWHMASDANGVVYFTKDLTDECYWVFAP